MQALYSTPPTSQTKTDYQLCLGLFSSLVFIPQWKNDKNCQGVEEQGQIRSFAQKNYTIYQNQLFVSVLLTPKFTMRNFIQTQLHSSVIYWQSGQEKLSGFS